MNAPASITVTPIFVADLLAESERIPIYVHVIDHPDARVLVDTGLTELHPAVADIDPRLRPAERSRTSISPASTSSSTRTFTSTIAAATTSSPASRSTSSVGSSTTRTARTTTPSANGSMRPACSTCRSTASSSCCPASASSQRRATHRGTQIVVVETGGRPIVVAGDTAVSFAELDEPRTEGQRLIRALDPAEVWLSHEHEPWQLLP